MTTHRTALIRFIAPVDYLDALALGGALKSTVDNVRKYHAKIGFEIEPITSATDLSTALSKPASLIIISAHGSAKDRAWIASTDKPDDPVYLDQIDARIAADGLLIDTCYGRDDKFVQVFARNLAPGQQTAYVATREAIHTWQSITLWQTMLLSLLSEETSEIITADRVAAAAHRAINALPVLLDGVRSKDYAFAQWPTIDIIPDLAEKLPSVSAAA